MDRFPRATDEILPVLRAATGPGHQRLETMVNIEECVDDQARYRHLLQTFLGFYRPLEGRLEAIQGWREQGLDLTERRKTPWLEEDLTDLGLTAVEIDRLPTCEHLPPAASLVRGFGCLYVLEGATLGGRQITELMRHSQVSTTARRFFGSYGANTGARWREFTTALEQLAVTGGGAAGEQIVQAAQETFTCMYDWLAVRKFP